MLESSAHLAFLEARPDAWILALVAESLVASVILLAWAARRLRYHGDSRRASDRLRASAVVVALGALGGLVGALLVTSPRLLVVGLLSAVAVAVLASMLSRLPRLLDREIRLHWWQTALFLTFASGLVLRVRSTATASADPIDSAGAFRVALVALAACCAIGVCVVRQIDIFATLSRGVFLPMVAFNVVNILSTAWSVYPLWTLYRSVEFAVDTLVVAAIAAYFGNAFEFRRVFNCAWLLGWLVLLSVGIGAVVAPGRAFLHHLGTIGISIQGVFPAVDQWRWALGGDSGRRGGCEVGNGHGAPPGMGKLGGGCGWRNHSLPDSLRRCLPPSRNDFGSDSNPPARLCCGGARCRPWPGVRHESG